MTTRQTIVVSLVLALVVGAFSTNFESTTRLLSAASPIVTLCLALLALHVWRVQLVMKRRFEVAEEALKISQEVVYALSEIRDLFPSRDEGKTRKRRITETTAESTSLDEAFITLERTARYDDLFATLSKSITLVEIHLGDELASNMRALSVARSRVRGAARIVQRLAGKDVLTAEEEAQMKYAASLMYETDFAPWEEQSDSDDVLTPHINRSLEAINSECRRYLGTPRFKDSLNVWTS